MWAGKKTYNYAIEFTSASSQMRGDDIDTLHTLSLADMQAMMLFDNAVQCSAVETATSALPFLEALMLMYRCLDIFKDSMKTKLLKALPLSEIGGETTCLNNGALYAMRRPK